MNDFSHSLALEPISVDTLRDYIKSVYRKLHVHSRGEAVAKFIKS